MRHSASHLCYQSETVITGAARKVSEFDQAPYVTRAIAGLMMGGLLGARCHH